MTEALFVLGQDSKGDRVSILLDNRLLSRQWPWVGNLVCPKSLGSLEVLAWLLPSCHCL